jgi:hypothetical protein
MVGRHGACLHVHPHGRTVKEPRTGGDVVSSSRGVFLTTEGGTATASGGNAGAKVEASVSPSLNGNAPRVRGLSNGDRPRDTRRAHVAPAGATRTPRSLSPLDRGLVLVKSAASPPPP